MSIQLHFQDSLKNKEKKFNCISYSMNNAGKSVYSDIPCFVNYGTGISYNKNTLFKVENNHITTNYNNQKFCISNNKKSLRMSIYEDDCMTYSGEDQLKFEKYTIDITKSI